MAPSYQSAPRKSRDLTLRLGRMDVKFGLRMGDSRSRPIENALLQIFLMESFAHLSFYVKNKKRKTIWRPPWFGCILLLSQMKGWLPTMKHKLTALLAALLLTLSLLPAQARAAEVPPPADPPAVSDTEDPGPPANLGRGREPRRKSQETIIERIKRGIPAPTLLLHPFQGKSGPGRFRSLYKERRRPDNTPCTSQGPLYENSIRQ